MQVIDRGWLDIAEIAAYNNWVEGGQVFDDACNGYLASNPESESNPNPGTEAPEDAVEESWTQKLVVWVLLCGAAYVLITVIRRVCRSYSTLPYTVIEDVDDEEDFSSNDRL
jgi:hypothetical protein